MVQREPANPRRSTPPPMITYISISVRASCPAITTKARKLSRAEIAATRFPPGEENHPARLMLEMSVELTAIP